MTDVLTVLIAVISAVLVGFVARRILETPVGWPRSLIVGLLVFVCGVPFATWMVEQSGLVTGGRVRDGGDAFAVLAIILLSLAWMFALGTAALVALEVLLPTRPLSNPIDVVRAAVRRRKRTRRYLEILRISSRHGADWIFRDTPRGPDAPSASGERAKALISSINDAGVTFVKLGQVLSTRRDLVPEPYLSALGSLQSDANTIEWETIRLAVEEGMGRPVGSVFASFNHEPLAAASVAQVHLAELLDGTPVVVKVQRPAARAQVEADVDIVLRLARRAELHSRAGHDLRLESVARGFTTTLLDELDYGIEAMNAHMISVTLDRISGRDDPPAVTITAPRVHPEASGSRVLTMDLVDGSPLSRAGNDLSARTVEQRRELADALMATVLEQILVYGVFHADLHPGNVILRPDGTLGLIDFGAVGVIERSQRQCLVALLLAALAEDDVAAVDSLLLIVDVPAGQDIDALRHDIGVVLATEPLRPRSDSSVFTRLVDVMRHHRIALPGDLAAAFRSLATLEGCLTVIDPDFDMFQRALPVVPKLLQRTLTPEALSVGAEAQAAVIAVRSQLLPGRLDALVTRIQDGAIDVRLAASDGAPGQGLVYAVTSELVGSLISIAAAVIAVVLIVTDAGPVITGDLRLFDLLGATIGLFGFLGLLRVVRQTVVRRRS